MKAQAFSYVKPRSLDEAFEVIDRYGEDARLLAGGQSLMAALNMRLDAPRVLIDINGLAELAQIRLDSGLITIGALARHRTVERSPEVARHLPLIHEAMPFVAHAAVRNRGTCGGSIALADPAAELPACCLALDATFVLRSRSGERRVAAGEFFKGLYETDLRLGEVLVRAEFPVSGDDRRCSFQEFARRHGDYAIVGIAACARMKDGVMSEVRLAFCGMGPTPLLARDAAGVLEGQIFSPDGIVRAQALLEQDLAPFDDLYQSASTRMHLARVLLGRVLGQMGAGNDR